MTYPAPGGATAGLKASLRTLWQDSPIHAPHDTNLNDLTFLAELLEQSHAMPADQLASAVSSLAEGVGLRDVEVYLADYEQISLVPLPRPGSTATALLIDSTLAGRAFIAMELLVGSVEGDERIWAPLLDGAERVGTLAATVTTADEGTRRLCEALASIVALLVISKNSYTDLQEKCRRSRDAGLASELQLAMLPPLTFVHPQLAIAGVLEDAYETGGDAFDYAMNGQTGHFAIFDAMGHGLSASLLAAAVIAGYRNCRRRGLNLTETFATLDRMVATEFSGDEFVTAQLGEVDVDSGEFTWINAGHPLPLIVRQGHRVSTLVGEPTYPLGMGTTALDPTTPRRPLADRLSPGDRLLFYSDGVVDARAPSGEPFGEARLADLLARQCLARVPPAETMRRLLHAVVAHPGSDLTDDATMVLIEWPGPRPPV